MIALVPEHCLSFYFSAKFLLKYLAGGVIHCCIVVGNHGIYPNH